MITISKKKSMKNQILFDLYRKELEKNRKRFARYPSKSNLVFGFRAKEATHL